MCAARCLWSPLAFLAVAALAHSAHALHSYCNANNIDPNTYKSLENARLIHVQAIWRHDDRAPHSVQWDPKGPPPWKCVTASTRTGALKAEDCNLSDLTVKGYSQMVARGKAFKAVYSDRLAFLPLEYSDAQIHVRSTDADRTKLSARAFLTAAYPKAFRTGQEWVTYNPTVIMGAPGHDTLYHKKCRLRDFHLSEVAKSGAFAEHLTERAKWEKTQRVAQHLNTRQTTSIVEIADNIMTRHCHNFALPAPPEGIAINADAIVDEAQKWIKRQDEIVHSNGLHATASDRLGYGEFLKEIRDAIIAKATGGPFLGTNRYKPAFYMQAKVSFVGAPVQHAGQTENFFAHDDLFMAFLGLFRATDLSWPAYGSNLIIELWRKDPSSSHTSRTESSANILVQSSTNDIDNHVDFNPYAVRILYNSLPLEVKVPWCDFAKGCPLIDFLRHTELMIVNDHAKECALVV